MHRDYTKICRVCMSEGSRDIFPKNLIDPTAASSSTSTSPLERLLEKLRYVTMMKIDENDDLPRLLCDLCIVQLNVAYNFKRQAVENDTKLRQYFIENGISSSHHHTGANNETASIRSSFTTSQIPAHRNFPIMPFIVKSEPTDIDGFSDATTETNLEIVSNTPIDRLNLSNTTNNSSSSQIQSNQNVFNKEGSNSSMVYVNGYAANSVTPSSDIEFIQNVHTTLRNNVNVECTTNFKTSDSFDSSTVVLEEFHNNSENIGRRSSSSKNRDVHSISKRTPHRLESKDRERDAERAQRNSELRKLIIDMNFSATDAPRKKKDITGRTTRTNEKTEKNDKLTKNSSKNENGFHSVAGKSTILLNPFNSKQSTNENLKFINKLKAHRKKRLSEKLLRPKIDPPSNNKFNMSK